MSYSHNDEKDKWLETTDYLNYEFLEPDQQREEVLNYLRQKLLDLANKQLELIESDIEAAVQHQMLIAVANKDMGTAFVLQDLVMTLHSLTK